MAKNLEMLRANPLYIPEGHDDRFSLLHDARFLAGAVASGVDLWRMAREVIPLEGYTPLANYDLDCIGLHCKSEGLRKYFDQVYGTLQIALVLFFGNIIKKA
jgi:hypothetical protein